MDWYMNQQQKRVSLMNPLLAYCSADLVVFLPNTESGWDIRSHPRCALPPFGRLGCATIAESINLNRSLHQTFVVVVNMTPK